MEYKRVDFKIRKKVLIMNKQSKNNFYRRYIEEDTLELYNINTMEMIDNKYIKIFGNMDIEYAGIILRKLYAHFIKEGWKINTPEDFLQLCNI